MSAGIAHAHFNKGSLVAASRPDGPRYRLWGDGTLFAGEDGAAQAALAAHASRQAIAELLEKGHTDITSREIFERFPSYVDVDGTLLSLPQWHETALRELCMRNLFGLRNTQAKRLLITLTSRRLGVPAEDYRQLRQLLKTRQGEP
jgi:cytosine/adenosine deaminase-related metal-dependent hydrolase